MKSSFFLLIILFLMVNGCTASSTAEMPTATPAWTLYATPIASLSVVPVFLGEMTFNEFNNSGFTQQHVVDWSSEDLRITTNGAVSGTFTTTYNGPSFPCAKFKDILFFQVQARYVYPQFGDVLHGTLSEVLPLVAQESSDHSAKFILDGTFEVPPLVKDVDNGLPLSHLELTLTWVRVYNNDQELYFQVFSGDANRYPNRPQILFNQEPQFVTARFGYYRVLPENAIKSSNTYDYYGWIKENIEW